MAVVLRKGANSSQAIEFSCFFVAIERAELRIAQGQISIGFQAGVIEESHVRRAVHGLEAVVDIRFFISHRRKHDVHVVVEMTGFFIQVFPYKMSRPNVLIPVARLHFPDVALHRVPQRLAFREEEGDSGADRFRGEEEQIQLFT